MTIPVTEATQRSLTELLKLKEDASSYEEYQAISREIDKIEHIDGWRSNDQSELYDYQKLRAHLTKLRQARADENVAELLYLVRTTFSRNIANMGDPRLYNVSNSGTKTLIEEYIIECEDALSYLAEADFGPGLRPTDPSPESILNTLVQTRKAFGRTALVLSGGSILGFLHVGVMRELIEQKLLPKLISGSSAGSIFASILCIHRDEEFDQMWDLLNIPMNIFEKTGEEESLMTHLKRFCTLGTWIDSSYLKEMMQGLIGDITFQEAYNRTGRILNVNVSVAGSHDMPRLLNYLTAPNVVIWSAVVCSCSVPLVFKADSILAKNMKTKELYSWTKRSFIDGSVDNDMPLGRLAEIFNVNHFIACQVNPHIAPLFNQDAGTSWKPPADRSVDRSVEKSDRTGNDNVSFDGTGSPVTGNGTGGSLFCLPSWVSSTLHHSFEIGRSLLLNEVEHGLLMMKTAGIAPSAASTMLNVIGQDYWGDITFVPPIQWRDVSKLFKNPDAKSIEEMIERGRKSTWSKLALLRNHCAIELALDRAIVELRAQLITDVALVRRVSPLKHSNYAAKQRLREQSTGSIMENGMASPERLPHSMSFNVTQLHRPSAVFQNTIPHSAGASRVVSFNMAYGEQSSSQANSNVTSPQYSSFQNTNFHKNSRDLGSLPSPPFLADSNHSHSRAPRNGRSQSSNNLAILARRNSGELLQRRARTHRRKSADNLFVSSPVHKYRQLHVYPGLAPKHAASTTDFRNKG